MDTNIGKSNIYNLDDSSVNEPNVGSANKISFTLLRNNINVRFGELLKSARDFFTDSTEPSPPALHPSSFEQNTTGLGFASDAGASNLHSDASKVLLSGSKVPQPITDQPINESLSASIASTKLKDGIQNSVIATLMDEMAILQQQVASLISAQKPCDRAPPLPSVTDVHQTPLKAPKPVLAERVEEEQVEHHFSVSTQFELFMLEQERHVAPATLRDYRRRFDVFFEVIPKSFDCRKLFKEHVQKIKSMLLARPIHATQRTTGKPLNPKTINFYLSNYRTFYAWLLNNVNGVEFNPFSSVAVKRNHLLSEKRRPFADDEVKRILDYKYIRKNEADGFRADVTWFIPISFYTGMRLNETSQIRLDDIKKVDEVWCFDLTGSDVKNESSRRLH